MTTKSPKLALAQARVKANKLIADARAKAKEILAEARKKAKEILAEAKKAKAKKAKAKKARAKKTSAKKAKASAKKAKKAKAKPEASVKPTVARDLKRAIAEAYLVLSHGAYNVKVPVYKLRYALDAVSSSALNKALLDLMGQSNVVLFREDDPEARTPELNRGALNLNGELKHYIKLTRAMSDGPFDIYGPPLPKNATMSLHQVMLRAASMAGPNHVPVPLAKLRYGLNRWGSRRDQDRALLRLAQYGQIDLVADPNPTESDRDSAITVRGKPKHLVVIL